MVVNIFCSRRTIAWFALVAILLYGVSTSHAQEIRINEHELSDSAMNAPQWTVDTSAIGAMMFADMPYTHADTTAIIGLTVSSERGKTRPSVISIMVPEPVDQGKGIYLSFATRTQRSDGSYALELDTNSEAHVSYQDCNSEFCTARMNDAYASGRVRGKAADLFADFMKYDYLLILYFDSSGHQNARIPLASFKQQYRIQP